MSIVNRRLDDWFKCRSLLLTNVHSSNFSSSLLFAALLSDTLRTYTKTGCDLEPLTLSCPRGTSISIDIAQYMPTSIDNECIATTGSTAENIIQDGVVNAGTEIEIKAPEKCSWPNVLSVSIRNSFTIANIRRGLLPSIDQIAFVSTRAGQTVQY